MSTLRTDTLQTTDSSFSINISAIASSVRLANNVDPLQGAALIGYNGGTVATALAATVGIISDLANATDIAKGAALVGYKGRTLAARLSEVASILDYIPVAEHANILNNTTTYDASANIQSALDSGKRVYFPNGTYKFASTLLFKADGYGIIGENMSKTKLVYTGTGGDGIKNDANTTTTRLFCTLENFQISGTVASGANLVNWKSFQFGTIRKVWFLGQSILGYTLLNMEANWIVTECTYNTVSECYLGNASNCIRVGDGANNNLIIATRCQPSVSTGVGVLFSGTAAERVSNNNVVGCGFEYPGAISTGINVLQNCNGIFMRGNRFEQMLNGIVVGAVGNKRIVGANRVDNYFDSCTTNINLSAGSRSSGHVLVGAGQFTGVGSLVEVGNAFNLTGSRTATGRYTFSYVDGSHPDTSAVVIVQAPLGLVTVTPSTSGFAVVTQTSGAVDTDAPYLMVTAYYNK